ncbi:MAG: tetratricopeptide repeat protein [Phycisphaerales bacterium]
MRLIHGTSLLTTMVVLAACASPHSSSPYAVQPESARDSIKAQSLTQEAASFIDSNPAKAEKLLRDALTADLYHGPAHNNLGVLYLKQGKLYEASSEFEWAKKLLPGHPDPRMNLALTLERAGRSSDALATYQSALDAYPDYMPAIQALTRLQLRTNKPDDQTQARLEDIALSGDSLRWREWARTQLVKLNE